MSDYNKIDQHSEYEDLKLAVRNVMADESGKLVLWHILSLCGVYDGGFSDGNLAYFSQGQRDIGLQILGLMGDVDPEIYPNMVIEMNRRK